MKPRSIAVFPAIRTEAQLLDQLRTLQGGERWTVSRVEAEGLETAELLVGLTWQTSAGRASLPMGFGPFPTMPATRRAPYVCLATWPGGHDNRTARSTGSRSSTSSTRGCRSR